MVWHDDPCALLLDDGPDVGAAAAAAVGEDVEGAVAAVEEACRAAYMALVQTAAGMEQVKGTDGAQGVVNLINK